MKNLLIVKMSALGDVVMSLPALMALKKSFPELAVDWLVEPPAAGLINGHPLLNRVIVSPRKKLSALIKSGRLIGAKRLWSGFSGELKAVEYDVVLDLQGLVKSAAMVRLARGRRKVGFAKTREHSGWALNEKMPAYDPERHAALRYLDAAAYLGAEVSETPPGRYYQPSEEAAAEARRLIGEKPCLAPTGALGRSGVGDCPAVSAGPGQASAGYLVLNPGAKWETKRWPLTAWKDLAAALAGRCDLDMVITGGSEDGEMGRAITEAVPGRVLNLCGRTSLPVLASVLEKAAMTITGDTGPMHLAAAVGGGGLAIFGPTRPWRTGPFGGHFQILTPPRDCLGCLKKKCGLGCLGSLTVNEVLAAALEYLGRARPSHAPKGPYKGRLI